MTNLAKNEKAKTKQVKNRDTKIATFVRDIVMPTLMVTIVLTVAIVLVGGEGIAQSFDWRDTQTGGAGDVAEVLAPLLVLALVIERLIETSFDIFERATGVVAELGTAASGGLAWLETELVEAQKATETIAKSFGASSVPSGDLERLKSLRVAEQRITEAKNRIANLTKDPQYVSIKRALSTLIGLFLGLIVAMLSDVRIFELLQISVPQPVDMLVTGFIIGTGSGPVHSLTGILQGAKDALKNLGELAALGPPRQQVNDLQSQIGR